MEHKESRSVFVIVREFPSVKAKLVKRQKKEGFDDFTEFIRNFWKELL